jgi:hypothetical protein
MEPRLGPGLRRPVRLRPHRAPRAGPGAPPPRAGAFDLDALRAALAPVGVDPKGIPLRPDALRIEARGRPCDAFDLVVVTLARDAAGKPYPDGTGAAVATEERRFRLRPGGGPVIESFTLLAIVGLAATVFATACLVCGMWAELRRFRADVEPALDWPAVNDFLAQHGCIPATRAVLEELAGAAGYSASYDPESNNMTIVDHGEAVRPPAPDDK